MFKANWNNFIENPILYKFTESLKVTGNFLMSDQQIASPSLTLTAYQFIGVLLLV